MHIYIDYDIEFDYEPVPTSAVIRVLQEFALDNGGRGQGLVKAISGVELEKTLSIRNTESDMAEKITCLEASNAELLAALEGVMPWASKAVADHYNKKQGKKALDAAYTAIQNQAILGGD